MLVKLYGHSDDCIELEIGPVRAPLVLLASSPIGATVNAIIRVATVRGTRAVHVHAVYDGGWSFAIGKAGCEADSSGDDLLPLPPWSFSVVDEHAYSTAIVIDTGSDLVEVTRVGGDE